jgi:hypothetical protein
MKGHDPVWLIHHLAGLEVSGARADHVRVLMRQTLSAVQLSSAGFSRHPTATTGPISQGGIYGHKQEAGLLPHTRPSLLLERYKCTADSAELAKIALVSRSHPKRVCGCLLLLDLNMIRCVSAAQNLNVQLIYPKDSAAIPPAAAGYNL